MPLLDSLGLKPTPQILAARQVVAKGPDIAEAESAKAGLSKSIKAAIGVAQSLSDPRSKAELAALLKAVDAERRQADAMADPAARARAYKAALENVDSAAGKAQRQEAKANATTAQPATKKETAAATHDTGAPDDDGPSEAQQAPAKHEADPAAPPQKAAGRKVRGGGNASAPMPPVNVEVGFGDNSLGLEQSEDGTQITIKHEKKHNVARENFKIWVIPCYVKADLKASIFGQLKLAKETVQGGVGGSVAGCLELGVGTSNEAVTAGPYGAAELSASQTINVTYDKKTKDASIEAFVINVHATGKVGVKIEVEKGPTFNTECQLANWHLFVIYMGAYANGKFESFRVEPGKDMQRLMAALQTVGPKVADAVEKYAPKFVKDAAVDAAKWTAESPTAKKVGDGTGVVLDKIKEKTGVDIGSKAESTVRTLVDPEGETSNEATARVQNEARAFNASTEDFHAAMEASGLRGELRPYRTNAEHDAIVDAWKSESERSILTRTPGTERWRGMLEALVAKARDAKAAKEANDKAKKRDEAEARKREDEAAAAALAEKVRLSMAEMEAARTKAQGPGNKLNNDTTATPNPNARKQWEIGMKNWLAGETARKHAQGLQGQPKADMARQATAEYVKARSFFLTGQAQL